MAQPAPSNNEQVVPDLPDKPVSANRGMLATLLILHGIGLLLLILWLALPILRSFGVVSDYLLVDNLDKVPSIGFAFGIMVWFPALLIFLAPLSWILNGFGKIRAALLVSILEVIVIVVAFTIFWLDFGHWLGVLAY